MKLVKMKINSFSSAHRQRGRDHSLLAHFTDVTERKVIGLPFPQVLPQTPQLKASLPDHLLSRSPFISPFQDSSDSKTHDCACSVML